MSDDAHTPLERQQQLALTRLGSRIQNDHGVWKVRKPHADMPDVMREVNMAMQAYHAAPPTARA